MSLAKRREAFAGCESLEAAVEIIGKDGICHKNYTFYTSLDRIHSMLTGKVPCLWLTRIDAEKFDDLQESRKYGTKATVKQSKTFIRCFSYGLRESAAMWGLYCPFTYKAIRVTISEAAMASLLDKGNSCLKMSKTGSLQKACRADKEFSDVIYASVKMSDEEVDRSNNLYWNGTFSKKIPSLCKDRCRAVAAGRIKDVEWSFENESRLIVTTAKKQTGSHIVIALPPEFIDGISFTLSPWANDDEEQFVKDKIVDWLQKAGRKNISSKAKDVFKPSTLKGALRKWAEQKGLA